MTVSYDHERSLAGVRADVNGHGGHAADDDAGDASAGETLPPLEIIQIDTALADNIDQAVRALRADPHVYTRGGQLVHVIRATGEEERASHIVEGTPLVRAMQLPTLRERLSRYGRFARYDGRRKKNPWTPCLPTDHIVSGVAARGHWPGLRELVGVLETPSMRPDGSIIQEPGYDRATGYEYIPNAEFPRVDPRPSQADACRALAQIADVFVDFPFASEAARFVPVAALLTIIARPAIDGPTPLFLYDATDYGVGKTLCTDAVCAAATGRVAPRATFPPSVEELEKVLGSYALQSPAVVVFDNLPGWIGGAPLDKTLTAADTVDLRVLGRSEAPSMRWRAVIMASGNNVSVLRDTVRRTLICRMESLVERPEERASFKHAPLVPWVLANRAALVAAALTVLRSFVVAGRPSQGLRAFGSFEAWAELVAASIVHAGGASVLDALPRDDADNSERAVLGVILDGWERLDTEKRGLTAREAIRRLYPGAGKTARQGELGLTSNAPGGADPSGGDGFDALRDAFEMVAHARGGGAPSPTALGAQLRRLRGRVAGGRRLVGEPDRKGFVRWKVSHV